MNNVLLITLAAALASPLGALAYERQPVGSEDRLADEPVFRMCEDAVRHEVEQSFGARAADFQDFRAVGNRITGTFYVRGNGYADQPHEFLCSVDRNRTAVSRLVIDPHGEADRGVTYGGSTPENRAIENCQSAADHRLRNEGYRHIDFGQVSVNDNRLRPDWVSGSVRADDELLNFSCRVDLQSGGIRSVNIKQP